MKRRRRLVSLLSVFSLLLLVCLLAPFFQGCASSQRAPNVVMSSVLTEQGLVQKKSSFTCEPSTDVPGSIGRYAAPALRSATPMLPAAHSEELWVIAKPPATEPSPQGNINQPNRSPVDSATPSSVDQQAQARQQQDDLPGSGALVATQNDGQKNVPIPLEHTEVTAKIQGYLASVNVKQRYHNPFDQKIEAVYVFPLPQDAAVSDFVMTIGQRRIRGIIRECKEAEQIYREARSQGYVASLMTQERPNIFTQKVANIEPGKKIDVDITYFNAMTYADGAYEFVFPMVVGPRFNPPGSTNGVGAVARGSVGSSAQATEVQYLRPQERSGHDISLSVDIDAGVQIEALDSRNHKVHVTRAQDNRALVSLDPADSIPNKDFVLRYKVAGDRVKTGMFVQRDDRGAATSP